MKNPMGILNKKNKIPSVNNHLIQDFQTEISVSDWKYLIKLGGVLALFAVLLEIAAVLICIFAKVPSLNSVLNYFTLLQKNSFIGVVYLGLLDVFAVSFYCPMILALYFILRQTNKFLTLIGTAFTLLGIAVYLSTVPIFAITTLSHQYQMATTDILRSQILASGQAVIAIGSPGTGSFLAFILMSIGGILVSIIMLSSPFFRKGTALIGIIANAITLTYSFSLVLFPSISLFIVWLSGLLYLVWITIISIKLLQYKLYE